MIKENDRTILNRDIDYNFTEKGERGKIMEEVLGMICIVVGASMIGFFTIPVFIALMFHLGKLYWYIVPEIIGIILVIVGVKLL